MQSKNIEWLDTALRSYCENVTQVQEYHIHSKTYTGHTVAVQGPYTSLTNAQTALSILKELPPDVYKELYGHSAEQKELFIEDKWR